MRIVETIFFLSVVIITMSTTNGESLSKTVYLIRHAESEENRRLRSFKTVVKSFSRLSWPSSSHVWAAAELLHVSNQVDSDVSPIGQLQIQTMAQQLAEINFMKHIQLVLHSPLVRAQQTAQGLLGCRPDTVRVEETSLLAEKTPTEWIPGQYYSFANRIQEFEQYLCQQEETHLVIVGHSQFFKAMLNLDYKFGNCDVYQVEFNGLQWSNLQKLYTCPKVDTVDAVDGPKEEA